MNGLVRIVWVRCVLNYAYGSCDKDRSIGMCMFVCFVTTEQQKMTEVFPGQSLEVVLPYKVTQRTNKKRRSREYLILVIH